MFDRLLSQAQDVVRGLALQALLVLRLCRCQSRGVVCCGAGELLCLLLCLAAEFTLALVEVVSFRLMMCLLSSELALLILELLLLICGNTKESHMHSPFHPGQSGLRITGQV